MTKFDFKGAYDDAPTSGKVSSYGTEEWAIEHKATIISALRLAARVQSGELVVVPREPTEDTLERMWDIMCSNMHGDGNGGMEVMPETELKIYSAMLAAAPKHDWSE